MEQISEQARGEIRQVVRASLSSGARVGAQLAAACRRALGAEFRPNEYGFANFRALLGEVVPEAQPVGRSGMDVSYEWTDAPLGVSTLGPVRRRSPWSAWANPESRTSVFVGCDGEIRIGEQRDGDKELPGTTTAQHRKIAREFLEGEALASDNRQALVQALGLDDGSWWPAWVRTLRAEHGLHNAWLGFRTQRLRALLDEQLSEVGLEPEVRQRAGVAFSPRRPTPASREKKSAAAAREESEAVVEFREVVRQVVQRMDESSLRDLLLPAGLMYEAVLSLRGK